MAVAETVRAALPVFGIVGPAVVEKLKLSRLG
jgi:hypothetical protein